MLYTVPNYKGRLLINRHSASLKKFYMGKSLAYFATASVTMKRVLMAATCYLVVKLNLTN